MFPRGWIPRFCDLLTFHSQQVKFTFSLKCLDLVTKYTSNNLLCFVSHLAVLHHSHSLDWHILATIPPPSLLTILGHHIYHVYKVAGWHISCVRSQSDFRSLIESALLTEFSKLSAIKWKWDCNASWILSGYFCLYFANFTVRPAVMITKGVEALIGI